MKLLCVHFIIENFIFLIQLESQINNLEQEQINIHTTYKSQLEQIEENMKSEREAKVNKF